MIILLRIFINNVIIISSIYMTEIIVKKENNYKINFSKMFFIIHNQYYHW